MTSVTTSNIYVTKNNISNFSLRLHVTSKEYHMLWQLPTAVNKLQFMKKEHIDDKNKIITIIVNGREHEVEKSDITYAEVVALAFENPPNDTTIFVVTYRRGHGNKEGTLVEGGSVKVKDGMIFNVTATNRA